MKSNKLTADELMRNNWVNYKGQIVAISTIDIRGLRLNAMSELRDISQFAGIPITRDILISAGFIRDEFVDSYNDHQITWFNEFFLYENMHSSEFEVMFAVYIKSDGSFKRGYTISHVHHLQNLFYSMTGKSLEINWNPLTAK